MSQQHRYRLPALFALASLVFVVALLAYEHLDGGVRGHHVLNRSDLPLISNWLGLIVLPLLGWLLGLRVRNVRNLPGAIRSLRAVWFGFGAALLYGAALAMFFEFDNSTMTSAFFFSLFVVAVALPIYRAECVLGFVIGMTFTFGGVLPAIIASIFATVSFLVRFIIRAVASLFRRPRLPPGAAQGPSTPTPLRDAA